jgi:hypothetical protein
MAPDTATLKYWPVARMIELGADPDPHIEAYCMHHYHSHFDWDTCSSSIESQPMSYTVDEQITPYAKHAHDRGKPFLITELGMFHYGWGRGDPAGVARHDNVLLETEFIMRGVRCGADSVLRWAWLNPGNQDGWWQFINTADGSDSAVENTYRGYGTLMRFISERAEVLQCDMMAYPGRPVTVHALAVKNLDGTRTTFLVNDDYRDCARVIVYMPTGGATTVRKIVNDPVRKYHYCGDIEAKSGRMEYSDILSPMSLTVYTTSERI